MRLNPAFGVAVIVTAVPVTYEYEQVVPQLIPAGLLIIKAVPAPTVFTVSVFVDLNTADTDLSDDIAIVHSEPLVLSQPLQLEKVYPVFGVAVSVTEAPAAYGVEHAEPQLIPEGELVIVPLPELFTVNVYVNPKAAVTVLFPAIATVH